jgi:uncharacterized protein YndB with AHSA1/START domain
MPAEIGALDAPARTLRFSRSYPHPVDRVWQAVTEPDHLAVWFPQTVVGDLLVPGASLQFESSIEDVPVFEGKVLKVEPPRMLEFEWGTDVIRIELLPVEEGCRLTLTDTLDVLGKAARDGAGWHACLDFLEAAVEGIEPSFTSVDRWRAVHPEYVRAFGPEASSIGPPASHSRYVEPE